MAKLNFIGNYEVDCLTDESTAYPRLTLVRDSNSYSVPGEYSSTEEEGALVFKKSNRIFLVKNTTVTPTPVYEDWSIDFYLDTVQSEVNLGDMTAFTSKNLPTLEDFYGENEDNVNRHLEVRYIGMDGDTETSFAPDGVYVPNSIDDQTTIEAAQNPDGFVDYDPTAMTLMFDSGSYGRKLYKLVYHAEPFTTPAAHVASEPSA